MTPIPKEAPPPPVCNHCPNPAACFKREDGEVVLACDACCKHLLTNTDGWIGRDCALLEENWCPVSDDEAHLGKWRLGQPCRYCGHPGATGSLRTQ